MKSYVINWKNINDIIMNNNKRVINILLITFILNYCAVLVFNANLITNDTYVALD